MTNQNWCYDCGELATHFAPEAYGKDEAPRPENVLCATCASIWESEGNGRIEALT